MTKFLSSFKPLLALSLVLTCVAAVADDANNEARLEKIRRNLDALKEQLETTRSSRDELLKSLEMSEKDIGELSKTADRLKGELEETKKSLKNLNDERSSLDSQKSSQQNQVSGYINSAYRLGKQTGMRLLLNQKNPATVARNIKYYDYFIAARSKKIQKFVETIARLNQIEPEISAKKDTLQRKYKALQQQKTDMHSAQDKRRNTLVRLNSSIHSKQESIKTLEADRSRLHKLLAKVTEWVGDIDLKQNNKPFAKSKGRLLWPTKGKVIKRFGNSRVSNKMRWEGILIQSPPGAPVHAVHHGRVVFSDYLRGHGLLIIVDHGGGYMTLYAHNQALYKELGEWVDGGDVIAAVGNSGGRQESALYFELRQKGQPTNPSGWFRSA